MYNLYLFERKVKQEEKQKKNEKVSAIQTQKRKGWSIALIVLEMRDGLIRKYKKRVTDFISHVRHPRFMTFQLEAAGETRPDKFMESLQETEKSLHPTRFKGREAMRISYSHEKERINVQFYRIRRSNLALVSRRNERSAVPPVTGQRELFYPSTRRKREGNRPTSAKNVPWLSRTSIRQFQRQKLQQHGSNIKALLLFSQKDFVDNRFEKRYIIIVKHVLQDESLQSWALKEIVSYPILPLM